MQQPKGKTRTMGSAEVGSDYVTFTVPRHLIESLLGALSGSLEGNNTDVGNASVLLPQAPTDFDPVEFLTEFGQACRIDYRLSDMTIREHMRHVQGLLIFLDKHPTRATRPELRQFLTTNPTVNAVKALRVLYGRFLDSDLAKCFKIPQYVPRVVMVPTKEQLQLTYKNLKTLELKVAFLLMATSGIRRHEAIELTASQIDLEKRMILPNGGQNPTKFQWVAFFNDEAIPPLKQLLFAKSPEPNDRILGLRNDPLKRGFERASATCGFNITPKVLRYWFCNEMGRLGVQDRFIDAFCGRVPKSVLARHYTDYSPDRLKAVYDKAGLKVLGG